ncbi:DUF928 domain-containing protein [Nostoc sp. UHCC 0702]|nr:DUF928 domain-containing protein [Nostoc sp. UHCC 0702]
MKTFLQSMISILPSALVLAIAIQNPALLQAQTTAPTPKKPASSQTKKSQLVFNWKKPPVGLSGISGRRIGMGSRDDCPAVENPLTALVPFQEQNLTSQINKASISESDSSIYVWGLTTNQYPTLWFYIPYTKDIAGVSAEFILQDSEENEVYQSPVSLPAKPGIKSVTLPSTGKPLEINKNYHWFFKVSCSGSENKPIYVEGDIQIVQLNTSLEEQLAASDPREKILLYAENGIWFDALTLLAQLQKASPNDASLISDWQSLFNSINFNQNYINTPVIE